jgi:hypothetical protein
LNYSTSKIQWIKPLLSRLEVSIRIKTMIPLKKGKTLQITLKLEENFTYLLKTNLETRINFLILQY